MQPHPLTFHPILKPKVWGGRRLERLGKTLPPGENIGESWELADLPATDPSGGGGEAARNVIADGPLAGQTINDAMRRWGADLLGSAEPTPEGGFPLLVKFLDARENLSVQTHPSEAYAAANPGAHIKHEAWCMLEAEPGARIYKGLRPGVTAEQFRDHIERGTTPEALASVEARPGEAHHLPSGTVHALGAGVLVAEVQTPSDTTFRVHDWGRTGRTLHIEQAMASIDFDQPPPPAAAPDETNEPRRRLVQTDAFTMDRLTADSTGRRERIDPGSAPRVWICVAGAGRIAADRDEFEPISIGRGATVLIPAGIAPAEAELTPGAVILDVRLPAAPSPSGRGMG